MQMLQKDKEGDGGGRRTQQELVKHYENRRLSTETVLNQLPTQFPKQYNLPKWLANGFGWNHRPKQSIWLPSCGCLASVGTNGAVSGSTCYGFNSHRISSQIGIITICGFVPHCHRSLVPNYRALIVALRCGGPVFDF